MALETVLSTIVRVKDKNGLYYPAFPINTTKEVYYNMNEKITLEKYLNENHCASEIYWVENIDLMNTIEGVVKGDMITVGGTKEQPNRIFFVKDVNPITYLELGSGSSNLIESINHTLLRDNWEAVNSIPSGGAGYKYTFSLPHPLEIGDADDMIEIEFGNDSIEAAIDAEVLPYCSTGSGNSIVLFSSFIPEKDLTILVIIHHIANFHIPKD